MAIFLGSIIIIWFIYRLVKKLNQGERFKSVVLNYEKNRVQHASLFIIDTKTGECNEVAYTEPKL